MTQTFLKKIGAFLVDIHGQGEQTTLFSPANHLEILDEYAELETERAKVFEKYQEMASVRRELETLREDEAQKLQIARYFAVSG